MPFDTFVQRANADPLISEAVYRDLINALPEESDVMAVTTRLPDMPSGRTRIPVMETLPEAFVRDGETDLIQTSNAQWKDTYVEAFNMDVVIPVSRDVYNDTDDDLWARISPALRQAFARRFDRVVLFGENKATQSTNGIFTDAVAKSHTVTLNTGSDILDDLNSALTLVENDGFTPTGHLADLSVRGKFRNLRDTNGSRINIEDFAANFGGVPRYMNKGNSIPASALIFSGDWSQVVYALSRDFEMRIEQSGVIQDGAGNISFNLMQQNMVGLICSMRVGWALPNPVNAVNTDGTSRYPFAVLTP